MYFFSKYPIFIFFVVKGYEAIFASLPVRRFSIVVLPTFGKPTSSTLMHSFLRSGISVSFTDAALISEMLFSTLSINEAALAINWLLALNTLSLSLAKKILFAHSLFNFWISFSVFLKCPSAILTLSTSTRALNISFWNGGRVSIEGYSFKKFSIFSVMFSSISLILSDSITFFLVRGLFLFAVIVVLKDFLIELSKISFAVASLAILIQS